MQVEWDGVSCEKNTKISETEGRQSGCRQRRAKGHRREQGLDAVTWLAVSLHEAPSHTFWKGLNSLNYCLVPFAARG